MMIFCSYKEARRAVFAALLSKLCLRTAVTLVIMHTFAEEEKALKRKNI